MNTSINLRDDRGRTFLWHAVYRFDRDNTIFILQCGGDPSLADNDGVTPFEIALHEGDDVAARLLLTFISINSASKVLPDGPKLDDLLLRHTGCFQKAEADLLKILLDLGANVNIRNRNKGTPLIEESRAGHQEETTSTSRPKIEMDLLRCTLLPGIINSKQWTCFCKTDESTSMRSTARGTPPSGGLHS